MWSEAYEWPWKTDHCFHSCWLDRGWVRVCIKQQDEVCALLQDVVGYHCNHPVGTGQLDNPHCPQNPSDSWKTLRWGRLSFAWLHVSLSLQDNWDTLKEDRGVPKGVRGVPKGVIKSLAFLQPCLDESHQIVPKAGAEFRCLTFLCRLHIMDVQLCS